MRFEIIHDLQVELTKIQKDIAVRDLTILNNRNSIIVLGQSMTKSRTDHCA